MFVCIRQLGGCVKAQARECRGDLEKVGLTTVGNSFLALSELLHRGLFPQLDQPVSQLALYTPLYCIFGNLRNTRWTDSRSPRYRQRAPPGEGGIAIRQQQVPCHRMFFPPVEHNLLLPLLPLERSIPGFWRWKRGERRGGDPRASNEGTRPVDTLNAFFACRTMSTMRSLLVPVVPVSVPPSVSLRPASTLPAFPSSSPREVTQSLPRVASTPPSATCTRTTGDGTCTTQ